MDYRGADHQAPVLNRVSLPQAGFLLGVGILALLLRYFQWRFNEIVAADGAMYTTVGYNLWHGLGYVNHKGGLAYFTAPVFPFLVGLLSLFVDDLVVCGRIVSTLFGALLIVPIFLLTRRIFGMRSALLGAVLVAVLPSLTKWSTYATLESTYMFFFFMAIYKGYCAMKEPRKSHLLWSSGLWGITALVRQEALLYAAISLVLLALKNLKEVRETPLTWAGKMGLWIGVYLAVTLPFMLFLYVETGSFRLNNKTDIGLNVTKRILETGDIELGYETGLMGLTADGLDIHNGQQLNRVQVDFPKMVAEHPREFIQFYLGMLYLIFEKYLEQLMPFFVIVLMSIGWWSTLQDGRHWEAGYLTAFLLPPLLLYPVFVNHERRFVPFVPIFIAWAAYGLDLFLRWLEDFICMGRRGKWIPYVCTGLFCIALSVQGIEEARRRYNPDRLIFKEVAEWIGSNLDDGTLMARSVFVNFYLGRRHVHIPYTHSYESFARYARYHRVRYILISNNLINRRYPNYIRDLYEQRNIPAEMHFIRKWQRGRIVLLLFEFQSEATDLPGAG